MKCEECLPRIEEYVDGELDGRITERIAAHLLTCARCASELAELRRDEELYAHYQRDIEVTPAQWNIVRARIEQEKDKREPAPARFSERLSAAFGSRRRGFRPAIACALLLLVVGITAGVIYLNSRQRQTNVAAGPTKPDQTLPLGGAIVAASPDGSNESRESIAEDEETERNNSGRQTLAVAAGNTGYVRPKKTAAIAASLPRAKNSRSTQPEPEHNAEPFDEGGDENVITGMRRSAVVATGNFDLDVARHAEKAELLLRSFRNVRLPSRSRSLDVSYEKEQSRRLLYRNIALRRDAAARGDAPAAELLNQLEPILLDIANLPNRARSRDVYSIEQRMEKKEIVATLQVRTLVAAN